MISLSGTCIILLIYKIDKIYIETGKPELIFLTKIMS